MPRPRHRDSQLDDYQSKLRQVDPNGAALRLEEVQLVELSMDHQAGQVWWTTVASYPLAEPLLSPPGRTIR